MFRTCNDPATVVAFETWFNSDGGIQGRRIASPISRDHVR